MKKKILLSTLLALHSFNTYPILDYLIRQLVAPILISFPVFVASRFDHTRKNIQSPYLVTYLNCSSDLVNNPAKLMGHVSSIIKKDFYQPYATNILTKKRDNDTYLVYQDFYPSPSSPREDQSRIELLVNKKDNSIQITHLRTMFPCSHLKNKEDDDIFESVYSKLREEFKASEKQTTRKNNPK